MQSLAVQLPGLNLKNPVMPAAGCFGYGQEFASYFDLNLLGAIVIKSVTKQPRAGHPTPNFVNLPQGTLNAIGIRNPGLEHVLHYELPWLAQFSTPIIANISGSTLEEYVELAATISRVEHVAALEINVSCPNVSCPNVTCGNMAFGVDAKMTGTLTGAVKAVSKKPIYVKLTPNVTDIVSIAKAAADHGADGLTMTNTVLGLSLDPQSGRPSLSNYMGGYSGPGIKPIVMRMIYQVAQEVDLPIIAVGGINQATDVIDYFSVGASAVQVGAAHYQDPLVCAKIIAALPHVLSELNIQHMNELRGRAWR